MSGTSASVNRNKGGIVLPVPKVRIHVNGDATGAHDMVQAGWMNKAEYKLVKGMNPRVFLLRYKRGQNPTRSHLQHSGYPYNNDRGWVHPADFSGSIVTSGRNYSGGDHTSVQGATLPVRASEWAVTDDSRYDAEFNPELWFLNTSAKVYTYPIVPLASSSASDPYLIGQSGQGKQDTGAYINQSARYMCGSTKTIGVQTQFFAFMFAVQDQADKRNWITGPMSQPIRADIWPKVQVNYPCRKFNDRGRKIAVRQW
jgi:hypothetical protein